MPKRLTFLDLFCGCGGMSLGFTKAGFAVKELYEDTNGEGRLHEMNIPTFLAIRSKKI